MNSAAESKFQFFISVKGPLAVISLVGDMGPTALENIGGLKSEVGKQQSSIFIFNLRDLGEISSDGVQVLAQLQKEIRLRPAEVRLCGLRPELKEKLLNKGVIRSLEIFDNLKTAIAAPIRVPPKAR